MHIIKILLIKSITEHINLTTPNGISNKIALYNNGLAIGIFLSYYPNGMIQDSIYFKNGIPVGLGGSWYANGNPKSETQMDTLGNGTGLATGYIIMSMAKKHLYINTQMNKPS